MRLKKILDKNIVICDCTYDEKDHPKSAGFRWDRDRRKWITSEIRSVKKIISDNPEIEISEGTRKWIDEQKKNIKKSKSINTDIDIPVPENLQYMPFQRAGIAYIAEKPNVLLADEMGLGKTIQAIGAINLDEKIKKILIVCPASLKINWKRELEKWLVKKYSISILSTKSAETDINNNDILIINYDILTKLESILLNQNFDLIIADECHYVKNYKANRSKSFYSIAKKSRKKIYLTGTPILNRPVEIYGLLQSLHAEWTGNWFHFVKKYCNGYQTRYGWDVSGASNLDELQENLRTSVMIRRSKKDVLTELPDKIRQVVCLPSNGMTNQIKKEQKFWFETEAKKMELQKKKAKAKKENNEQLYRQAVAELENHNRIAFTEIAKLRRENAILKIPAVIEYIENILDNNQKIVVFAHHKEVIQKIQEKFSDVSVVLTGETSQENRQRAVDNFQTNSKIRLFIGSIQAAGVGITLTAASTVIFAEMDWTPANMSQAEDRCHRIGQKSSVLVQNLVVDGSIDSMMAKKIIEKQEIIEKSLDK